VNDDQDEIAKWLASEKHLPGFMRDFHAQKALFKAVHRSVDVQGGEYTKGIDWVAGQCYTIDVFLRWMAKHGYTLSRSRKRLKFDYADEYV